MNKFKFFIWVSILALWTVQAQESLVNSEGVYPQVHPDGRVTFKFRAPEAQEVKLSGDWMPNLPSGRVTRDFQKQGDSLWTYTTKPLPSELYWYHFIVDGVRTIDPLNTFVIRDVSSIFNLFIVPGEKGDLYGVQKVPHGTVTQRWYESSSLGITRRMTVYTPPGYESSDTHYPILYLLHGAGGDEKAWSDLGRAPQILDNLIAAGKAEPMIVVMPNGNVVQEAAPGEGSTGLTQPSFQESSMRMGEYEPSFKDIITFVESQYRVKSEHGQRAIAGLSMGGFHSLHISRTYPKTFDYIGLFSPAILPWNNPDAAVYQNMDRTLKTQKENGYKLYWIAIGKEDFLYDQVRDYRKRLDAIDMPYEYLETEGGHVWYLWREYLTAFSQRLFKEAP